MSEHLLTGERTWPGVDRENYWFMRHLACYRWAAQTIRQDSPPGLLLDAGSGEGYGAAELAASCERDVVAVELDAPTAAHARNRYQDLAHVRANLVALPFHSQAFAAAVSLQVVEHIWDPWAYLRELARCTEGPVILSTPNRSVHSPGLERGESPDNPFHVREFDAEELIELLNAADQERSPVIYGLRHGERIRTWEEGFGQLPRCLLEDSSDVSAATFAQTVASSDFTIEKIDASEPSPDIHDLVAIW